MTNREIKLELARIALATCRHMTSESLTESIKNLYDWIIEEPETEVQDEPKTDYDKMDISLLLYAISKDRHRNIGGYGVRLSKIFYENNINTIGELLRIGRINFKDYKNVGDGCLSRIDEALEELGVKGW